MDAQFGTPETVDGEIRIPVSTAVGRPMFKQFNNVSIEDVTDDSIVFNLQDVDVSSYDQDLLAAAKTHKQEWFGRELADKTIDKAYTSPVDGTNFTTTILKDKFRCYDHEKNLVDIENIEQGARCSVVVELKRLWFVKRNFGPEWFSVQVRMDKPPEKDPYDDYLFQEE